MAKINHTSCLHFYDMICLDINYYTGYVFSREKIQYFTFFFILVFSCILYTALLLKEISKALKWPRPSSHPKTNLKTGYMNCYKNNYDSFGRSLRVPPKAVTCLTLKKIFIILFPRCKERFDKEGDNIVKWRIILGASYKKHIFIFTYWKMTNHQCCFVF